MNLANPRIQKAIIEIAESSESNEVAEVCKLVIQDHVEQGDTEIESPREVILTALECVETSQSYYEKKLARVLKHAEKYITTDQQLAEFRELIADEATDTRKETE
jgi:hypothetical protein